MWHFTFWYPGSMFSIPFSQGLKKIRTSFISLHMASHHNVLRFSSPNLFASAASRWTLIPNSWVLVQYMDVVFAMIRLLLFITKGTHHAKAGSCDIRNSTTYSATCARNDYFMSFRATHVVELSFHWTIIFQPGIFPSLRARTSSNKHVLLLYLISIRNMVNDLIEE